ncbi:proline--tRNA ligase [Magnetospirillum gryphiswaldense]|uniref:Proline--tRNA ligase n=2 Tax=Magnetospirillum gryphiswaldense TaxID=55518 RepID=V6EYK1_MAGGM|nr:proline--tRNA ligase [Magnetospirillum gryphiswaldense]AVM73653.1 Proline--tRNA ligase [Magnetospirillum gryphiswaldense MSR-1]AVM77556.1 Proline--tRNA ligase [Magnetospirillum gryphiswaldense]CAM76708.1 prolyl-tRNA synthetase [Magnetospirillum gryphiswaldense MSR-1]CDK98325.1 Prolyl-tRNA synthetase (Proline--tRNA ligase) (ProRS) [Magnetospirillum gryphiswaldense MSR-1 v2]
MRLSRFFLPTLKETPSEAQIASHRLMLRAGMIRQSASGIYTWLPLGWKVLQKIEQIVREEQDAAGAQELLMPTIQSADIWRESGRYDAYGKEMLRIVDRHDREMLFGPTNEELITQIFRDNVKSYRELPKILYHIQWKFRDEVRPRFGVMRGREFLMKDSYSFDIDFDGAKRSYEAMFNAYLRTFKRMGLTAIPMVADSGAIGGNLTHEFHVLAETGESGVFYDVAYEELAAKDAVDLEALSKLYAVTDEKHDPNSPECPPADRLKVARGIEVGHIFYFGTKYSKAMGAVVAGPDGNPVHVEMGSYGIGVSRLVGAIIEAYHDDRGIKWPEAVAPFKVGLINLKAGDGACDRVCEDMYRALSEQGVEVLYDDRDDRAGVKFADMDLIGLPWQLVAGPKGVAAGLVELKNRHTGEKQELSVEAALAQLTA